MIRDSLQGKDSKQRAQIKGRELAKIKKVAKKKAGEYKIEIVDTKEITGGVEVFARAWKGRSQIGFGADGTVDIERFRIINPPILIADKNGDIEHRDVDDDGVETIQKFREDPTETLLDVLAHTIKVKQEKAGSKNIIPGKIGNTTSTFYPAVDGQAGRVSVDESFATIRAAAGNTSTSGGTTMNVRLDCSSTTDQYDVWRRIVVEFDTSSLGTDKINTATFSLYGTAVQDNLSQSAVVDRRTSTTGATVQDADYAVSGWAGVEQSTIRIPYSEWSTSGYNDFPLNATGVGNISGVADTLLGLRASSDFDNSAPTWSSLANSEVKCSASGETGTSQDPKFVVEHVSSDTETVEYLVVGGGGQGGCTVGGGGGGGGAGGVFFGFAHTVTEQAYTITVGAGGSGSQSPGVQGADGGDSSFDTITATGGGGGGSWTTNPNGRAGGSGGGGSHSGTGGAGDGIPEGNDGADGTVSDAAGGGGGAGLPGSLGTASSFGGDGGDGISSSISGSAVTYGGGGGGGTADTSSPYDSGGSGGAGGGGDGSSDPGTPTSGSDGTDNLGGGGGGGPTLANQSDLGGDGGDGVVIFAYATDGSDGPDPSTTTGGTITTSGGNTIHTFNSSGTFTVSFGASGPATLKTANTATAATTKTRNTVAIESVKTWDTAA